MSQRAFKPIAVVVLAALGLLACGGGGADDEQAIERAVKQAITTKDVALKCEQLATQSFVKRVYGNPAQCRKAEQPSAGDQRPTGATTSDVKVDGDSATVRVQVSGGASDGAAGTIDLRREDDHWRVDDLGVDYLRSRIQTGLASPGQTAPELRDPSVRSCTRQAFQRLPDAELRRIAYSAIAETDAGRAELGKLLVPCLAKSGSGAAGILPAPEARV